MNDEKTCLFRRRVLLIAAPLSALISLLLSYAAEGNHLESLSARLRITFVDPFGVAWLLSRESPLAVIPCIALLICAVWFALRCTSRPAIVLAASLAGCLWVGASWFTWAMERG
jgi:hypothetical protein